MLSVRKLQCSFFVLFAPFFILAPLVFSQELSSEPQPTTTTPKILSLEDCKILAEAHYPPLQLAKQEIEVADAKVMEAARELWPNLAAKGEYTKGAAIVDLGTPGFTEKSFGLQATYTVFQGGRLWYAYQEAVANQKIAQLKYEKTRQEMIYQLTEAYWNLSRAQANVADYELAYQDVSHYAQMADKLQQTGTLMKKMMLATASQKSQCQYQIYSTRAEAEKFIWKWAEAIGAAELPEGRPVTEIPFGMVEVDLQECLKSAEEHNLDLQIQHYTLLASQYEKKVKDSYDWPKVELNGFYGRSGGAYEAEDLELREDYNFGVKVTQPLEWNTLALSGFSQKTSPKLGQSTLTESKTASGTFSILDGYKANTEKTEARWHLNQASYSLDKNKQDVASEVREAYYNFHKALAQVQSAQLDADLAERELAIAKINLRDDKATLPEVSEARNKLVGSRVSMREARAFYLLALAALNKALGLADRFAIQDQKNMEHEGEVK